MRSGEDVVDAGFVDGRLAVWGIPTAVLVAPPLLVGDEYRIAELESSEGLEREVAVERKLRARVHRHERAVTRHERVRDRDPDEVLRVSGVSLGLLDVLLDRDGVLDADSALAVEPPVRRVVPPAHEEGTRRKEAERPVQIEFAIDLVDARPADPHVEVVTAGRIAAEKARSASRIGAKAACLGDHVDHSGLGLPVLGVEGARDDLEFLDPAVLDLDLTASAELIRNWDAVDKIGHLARTTAPQVEPPARVVGHARLQLEQVADFLDW